MPDFPGYASTEHLGDGGYDRPVRVVEQATVALLDEAFHWVMQDRPDVPVGTRQLSGLVAPWLGVLRASGLPGRSQSTGKGRNRYW